jgi:hypothetical protein
MGEVFDFLADGSRNHLWQPEVASVIFAAGPSERAVWAQTILVNGRERKSDYRVTFYDRPSRIEFTVFSGRTRPVFGWELRALDAGTTRVSLVVSLSPRWSPFPTVRFGAKDADAAVQRIHALAAALGGESSAR